MAEVHMTAPPTEVGVLGVVFEIRNGESKRVGNLTINKKWLAFRRVNCMNIKKIPLGKLPEVFDSLGK